VKKIAQFFRDGGKTEEELKNQKAIYMEKMEIHKISMD